MAHHIETHGDQAAAVFARKSAWHELGTTVAGEAFTAEEAMRLGHLGGWDVTTVPLTAHEVTEDGVHSIEVPGQFATVRTNPFTGQREALGVVGSQYHPIQNEEHAEVLNRLVDDSGAIFDTAGSLKGGRQVFITMRLPQSIKVAGVDEIEMNIAALNSHDGTQAFRLLVTPIRVVCANTQHAALRDHRASVVVKHTASAAGRIAAAREALGMTFEYVEAFEAEAEAMIQRTISEGQFAEATRDLFGWTSEPSKTQRKNQERREAALLGLFGDAGTQTPIRGTHWAAYQAVAEYIDHYAPVRAKTGQAAARAERLLTTEGPARVKAAAWARFATA